MKKQLIKVGVKNYSFSLLLAGKGLQSALFNQNRRYYNLSCYPFVRHPVFTGLRQVYLQ